ncbi:hypothetical protein ICW40_03425 [Actinotalea ferrariae]|uniref:hypothetical protein n=1 Tax=Actinotalea ferrariae TaxID=1386098 RepID=UPI001C8B1957|nr:hypothetical protein [Actinotalea ferrariae]MBX9243855.1 hypothetical protein [Actinotalea ferrariae]
MAKHAERQETVLARLKDLTDDDLSTQDRRFIKDNLQKRPSSSLDGALVKGLRASGRATSTSDALRHVRNDLAHGNRGYAFDELDEVVAVLERIVRGHALRLLGCPDLVVARVFDGD